MKMKVESYSPSCSVGQEDSAYSSAYFACSAYSAAAYFVPSADPSCLAAAPWVSAHSAHPSFDSAAFASIVVEGFVVIVAFVFDFVSFLQHFLRHLDCNNQGHKKH